MNSIAKNALRTSTLRGVLSLFNSSSNQSATRSLWNTCSRRQGAEVTSFAYSMKLQNDFHGSRCYSSKSHTKAEKELVEFLAEEIVAEKKAQKLRTISTTLDGFAVSLNSAEVNLEKKLDGDTIHISFNVNHTVNTDADVDPIKDDEEIGEMKSKPTFTVDIVRNNQTLGFTCSFNNQPGASGQDDGYNDIFGIDEITLYDGEHNEKVYSVAGEILDGYLYDLLMNYLEEKGISNEFAEKLSELSTCYEHTAYVSLLEGLAKFTSGK